MESRDDGEHADPVGDEIRRVLGVNHAFAERGNEKGLEPLQNPRRSPLARDQFHQVHVARRIEEMHAAEASAQFLGQHRRQRLD